MEQLVELFDQIIEMAKAGRDALKGAAADTGHGGGGEQPPPEAEGKAEGAPDHEPAGGGAPPEEKPRY